MTHAVTAGMPTIPAPTQALLERIVSGLRAILLDNLAGIYLHGSLAMGEFNPNASDIDFLVVVRDPLDLETKRAVAALTLLLAPDAPPKGLEFSVVLLKYTRDFIYPTPFEFHASPVWYEALRTGEIDLMAAREDPDLAAHFTITRARGICLYGDPIAEVFGEIPEADYWASIRADAADILDHMPSNPVYSILNLCRVLAFQQSKLITSKGEGGRWALDHLDARFHPLIRQALDAYQSAAPSAYGWDEDTLSTFSDYARKLLNE